jgi:hypothetical protein
MIEMNETRTVARSPDEVLAILADLNNFPKWRANVSVRDWSTTVSSPSVRWASARRIRTIKCSSSAAGVDSCSAGRSARIGDLGSMQRFAYKQAPICEHEIGRAASSAG